MCLRLIFVVFFAGACVGCGDNIPDEVLSLDEMQSVLQDFHLIEAGLRVETDLLEVEREARRDTLYDRVLANHDLERETFYESYEYYLSRPELMDSVYRRMIDSLNRILPYEQERRAKKP